MNTALWRLVRLELDRWAAEGLTAQFWVRDDDACEVTPALERLAQLAARHAVRIGLAVVPARLTSGLADRLASPASPFWPMCHGWTHANHGSAARPAEFGPERPYAELKADAMRAREAYARHLGDEPPVFVPPFGQITDELAQALPSLGFAMLSNGPSLFEARLARVHARTGLLPTNPLQPAPPRRLDVHIDPIDWRAKTAHSREEIERQLVGELRIRRKRHIPPMTPIGLLTHHLVHDAAIWEACEALLAMLRGHRAAAFPDPRQLMRQAVSGRAGATASQGANAQGDGSKVKVSVIIKALNEENNIARAIESSLRAVAPFGGEVVLADSVSSDRTIEIASQYPIRIVQLADASERCCGIAPQLGYQHSRGEYVYILDGDMDLDAQFLKDGIELLDRQADVAGVGGFIAEKRALNLQFQRRMKRVLEQRAKEPKEARCLSGGGLYRRSAIESVSYISDRNLKAYEEYDLGVRLRGKGWRLLHVPARAADHYSYVLNSAQLLWLKLRGGSFLSQGQIVRAALLGNYLPQAFREIFALRLSAAVWSCWLAVLLTLLMLPYPMLVVGAAVAANLGLVLLVGLMHESLGSGLLSVVNWNLLAFSALPGFFKGRRPPAQAIASRILRDAEAVSASPPSDTTDAENTHKIDILRSMP